MSNIKLILVLLSVIFLSSQMSCKEAILQVSNGSSSGKEYCLDYDPMWSNNLSETLEDAVEHRLADLTRNPLCNVSSAVRPEEVKGAALVVTRGRCGLVQKARVAWDLGASALLVAGNGTSIPSLSANEPRLPLLSMWYGDFLDARRLFGGGGGMRAKLYAPPPPRLDPSLLVMLLIAVTTVVLGGYWSGAAERERLAEVGGASGTGRGGGGGGGAEDKEESFDSPLQVLLLVAMLCVMLLLMYYFYDVMVYAVIAMFCVGSAGALFGCLDALMDRLGVGAPRLSVRRLDVCVRSALLAAGCVGVAAVWAVYRKETAWIWILQNVLGVAFCCISIKTIPLSSFRICSLLFGLLLAYDVFFVFVTRLFTADGVSVMAQVALGPGGGAAAAERLPVVMLVPRLLARSPCGTGFSILGYGDMVVPGLLVAYCSRFDQRIESSGKVYFASCCVAYLLGMLATFAAMLLSGEAQPALLYLVPSTLTGAALVAWSRGEMRRFWTGNTDEKEEELTTAP